MVLALAPVVSSESAKAIVVEAASMSTVNVVKVPSIVGAVAFST